MCGIAGFSLSDNEPKVKEEKDGKRTRYTTLAYDLAYELLDDIESRGRDATGWAKFDPGSGIKFHKAPMTASKFMKTGQLHGVNGQTVILHTRLGTTGSEEHNENNHPVVVGRRIVGVHNGVIDNHRSLFADKNLGLPDREAEVDTEALFALIHKGGVNLAAEKATGRAAAAWLDSQAPNLLHLARFGGSPLWIGETEAGSILFASTKRAVEEAVKYADLTDLQHCEEMKEGRYTTFANGRCITQPKVIKVMGHGSYQSANVNTSNASKGSKRNTYMHPQWCNRCKANTCICEYNTAPLPPYPPSTIWPLAPKGYTRNGEFVTPGITTDKVVCNRVLGGHVVPWQVWKEWKDEADDLKLETDDAMVLGFPMPPAKKEEKEDRDRYDSLHPTVVCDLDSMLEDVKYPWGASLSRALPVGELFTMMGNIFKHTTLGQHRRVDNIDLEHVVYLNPKLYFNGAGSVNNDGVFVLKKDMTFKDACLPVGTIYTNFDRHDLKVTTKDSYRSLGLYEKGRRDLLALWRDQLRKANEPTHLDLVEGIIDGDIAPPENLLYLIRWSDDAQSWVFNRRADGERWEGLLARYEKEENIPSEKARVTVIEHIDTEGEATSTQEIPYYSDIDEACLSFLLCPTLWDMWYFGGVADEPTCVWSAEKDSDPPVYDDAVHRVLKAWADPDINEMIDDALAGDPDTTRTTHTTAIDTTSTEKK